MSLIILSSAVKVLREGKKSINMSFLSLFLDIFKDFKLIKYLNSLKSIIWLLERFKSFNLIRSLHSKEPSVFRELNFLPDKSNYVISSK